MKVQQSIFITKITDIKKKKKKKAKQGRKSRSKGLNLHEKTKKKCIERGQRIRM